jgi:hypothetical protein
MSQVLNSSAQPAWFEEIDIDQGDGPLILADGQSVSVLQHELRYLVERGDP